ncbi:hypothetical protein KBW71_01245 [Hydrogenophaga aromaticivorans]|uniref:hypothetical protein n=1 Tax=Hydrogenophaga aromaticivorans TaxID=2610898 RepID=UPI001B37D02F|nr:hypothetical protein [Hydrogenophaga aromaticivorans]MBQ0917056.1 hypothetical protein [Hydrogenophaga aromaticivorans]MBU4337844.1 hypothetical protein [Actinomycetota bacterium]
MDELQEGFWEDHIQVSADQSTVWVHSSTDGSTVGRFSRRFGIDVHNTATEQLQGAPQCLNCTHEPAGRDDWAEFIALMHKHHGIPIASDLISFDEDQVTTGTSTG